MPRRRDPIKSRELSVLLRDAQTTDREIDGERNLRKQHERVRARDSAFEVLMRMYRDAKKRGNLDRLDIRVRNCIERRKASNRIRRRRLLPKPKGGKPFDARVKRLLLAVDVREAIEAHGKKRGRVGSALSEVADRRGVSSNYLREIHYDSDPEWQRDVKAELARRKCGGGVIRLQDTPVLEWPDDVWPD
jgi:hypothetical protein